MKIEVEDGAKAAVTFLFSFIVNRVDGVPAVALPPQPENL
jgi:hypothetical protein